MLIVYESSKSRYDLEVCSEIFSSILRVSSNDSILFMKLLQHNFLSHNIEYIE